MNPLGRAWRYFGTREVPLARAWVGEGGIAVHENLYRSRGRRSAHLLAPDEALLLAAARHLGCEAYWIQRTRTVHFDLVGVYLERALIICGVSPTRPPARWTTDGEGSIIDHRYLSPMQLLLTPHERQWLSLGALASAAIHATLLALIVAAYHEEPERPGFVEQFVTYLVPPDKPVRQEGSREQLGWTSDRRTEGVGDEPASPQATGPLVTGSSEKRDSVPAAEPPSDPIAELLGETSVLTELEVDSAVRRHPESAAPEYPRSMLARNLEGNVYVVFVVDTTGLVDTTTFRVLRASHPDFVAAIRAALPGMRFRPALLSGSPVRQLVEQPFTFKIKPPEPTRPPPPQPLERTEGPKD